MENELDYYKSVSNRLMGAVNAIRMNNDKEIRLLEIDLRQAETMLKDLKAKTEFKKPDEL